MVHIVLQVGQCGNQLGESLFTLAFQDAVSSWSYWDNVCGRDCWFSHGKSGELKARSVLVDADNKAASRLVGRKRHWSYDARNVVSHAAGGSKNNFAAGYSATGPRLWEGVEEAVRRESECCDRTRAIVSLAGGAGGTGSGAGSFLLERLRDRFPKTNLVSVLVLPYASGDAVTQYNNVLFTFAKQYGTCDAVVVFENDFVANSVAHNLQTKSAELADLNRVISHSMLSFLQPLKSGDRFVCMYDLLARLCPHSRHKLLTVSSFPLLAESRSKFDCPQSWGSVEKEMIRCVKSGSVAPYSDFINCLSNVVISRGELPPERCIGKLKNVFFYPDWMPPNQTFVHYHQPRPMLSQEKNLSLVSNSSRICGLLDSCVQKSWRLFTNNMYCHHYYKYGFSKDTFVAAFYEMESVLKAYKELN